MNNNSGLTRAKAVKNMEVEIHDTEAKHLPTMKTTIFESLLSRSAIRWRQLRAMQGGGSLKAFAYKPTKPQFMVGSKNWRNQTSQTMKKI